MQIALEVNNSSSDQAPSTTTESTNGIQQTRTSEGLTAPSQPNSTSAAEQQQLMNFLYSESAGQVYTGPTDQGTNTRQAFARLGIGTLIVVVAIMFAVVCQRQLNKLAQPAANTRNRSRTAKKRVK